MAPVITPIAAILAGKINIKIHCRVIHIWTIPDFSNPNEDGSMHMLLLDEKKGKIQASAKKHLIPKVKSLVEVGSAYEIENVLVTRNEPKYKCTEHKFKLNLIDKTNFTKIAGNKIPINHFDFMSFGDILESDQEEKTVDVIGHVVERDVMKEKDVNGRRSKLIDITLQDSESRRIHCTLWANYAERINSYLATHESGSPVVVVLQMCKLRKYCGAMGVSNAFYGTNLILDGDLPHIVDYKSSIDGADVQVTQGVSQQTSSTVVSLADDLLQSQMMTIEDLIETSDQGFGVVLGTICGIEPEYNWYYQACTKCAGRVKSVAGRLYCSKCNTGRNAVPRYKLHVQVIDSTGSTSFILFDRNVTNFVGRSVQDLIDAQPNNAKDYPTELDVFIGKQMLFKVEVTEANLLHNWRNYAVKRTTDDADIIGRFKVLHNIKISDGDDEADCHVVTAKKQLIEDGGSSKTAITLTDDDSMICTQNTHNAADGECTPSSKVVLKRSADDASDEKDENGAGDMSVTKPVKLKAVKIEPTD